MTKCKYIDDYIGTIRSGQVPASKEIHLAMNYIEKKLSNPDVEIRTEQINKAVDLIQRYFELTLLPWELFVIALQEFLPV